MTDDVVRTLRAQVRSAFRGARQIAVLAERDGRLMLVGEPTSTEITSVAMLLASVQIRLPWEHAYPSTTIPRSALLPLLERTDRGSILLAPVLENGVPVGAMVVEAKRGHAFSHADLARLEVIGTMGALTEIRA